MKGVCICAIAKMENRYIREWVEWYVNHLKVDKIFLYDNNDVDGEVFEDVINDYIDYGVVEVVDWRGNKDLQRQMKAYTECYHKHKDKYEWFCFFDIDEFLITPYGLRIDDFLNSDRFRDFQAVYPVWREYGDSGFVTDDGRGVLERFINEAKDFNPHVKTIIRGGLDDIVFNCNPHAVYSRPLHVALMDGSENSQQRINGLPKEYKNGYLAHYRTKTIDEYLKYKYTRQYPDKNRVNIDDFWLSNERTKEKEEYIEQWKKENILK